MATFYEEFDDPEGYVGDGVYVPGDGFVAIGCVKLTGLSFQAVGSTTPGGEGVTIVPGMSVWFAYKIFAGNGVAGNATIRVVIDFNEGGDSFDEEIAVLPQDNFWHLYTKDVSAYEGMTLTGINITSQPVGDPIDESTNYCYIDSIRSSPDAAPEQQPAAGNRLWIYKGTKNASGGYDWISRGIKT